MDLNIIQINLDKSKAATHMLEITANKQNIDIIMIQEPWAWKTSSGFELKGLPSEWPKWISLNGKAAIVFRNTHIHGATLDIKMNSVAIQLHVDGEDLVLASSYSSPYKNLHEAIHEMEELVLRNSRHKILISSDWNGHSCLWGYEDNNERGALIEDFILSKDLFLLNGDNKIPTYGHTGSYGWPHLTLCNSVELAQTIQWYVGEEPSLSSHSYIHISLKMHLEERISVRRYRTTQRRLLNYTQRLRTYIPDVINNIVISTTPSALEKATDKLFDTLQIVGDRTLLPSAKTGENGNALHNKKQSKWWTMELEVERKHYRALKRRYQRVPEEHKTRTWCIFSEFRAKYKKLVRRTRLMDWRNSCELAATVYGSVYKATMKTRSFPQMIMSANGNETVMEAASRQLNTIYPDVPDSSIPLVHNIGYDSYSNVESDDHIITWPEITRIVDRLENNKAPGLDKINNRMLKALNRTFPDLLYFLFNKCLQLGCFPAQFKNGKLLLFLKKGRDPKDLKSYRPISSLSSIGKVLERVIVQRIMFYTERANWWSDLQYGFRQGKSAEMALEDIMTEVRLQRSRGNDVALISLDIESAFDNLKYDSIVSRIMEMPVPNQLKVILCDVICMRKATLQTDAGMVTKFLQKGAPQGSCSGPLLWNLVLDELLHQEWPDNIRVQAFAADILVLASFPTVEGTGKLAEKALQQINNWLTTHSLSISSTKTQFLWISKKRPPTIWLTGGTIKRTEELRYLGITIDQKMSWVPHLIEQKTKVTNSLQKMRLMAGSQWGINQKMRRILYLTLAERTLAYGASIWFATPKVQLSNLLDSIQRKFLLYISGAYCTTPTNALQIILGLPPLSLKMDFLAKTARLLSLRKSVDTLDGSLDPREFEHKTSGWSVHPAIGIDYKQIRIDVEDKNESYDPSVLVYYTDGSKMENGTGAAFVKTRGKEILSTWSVKLKNANSVFQAELFAIYRAVSDASNTYEKVVIRSDSKSSLQAILDPLSVHELARRIRDLLCLHSRVSLAWVKAHEGQWGNELADCAAKNAVSNGILCEYLLSPASCAKTILWKDLLTKWQKKWDDETMPGRSTHGVLRRVSVNNHKWSREMIMFVTGHGPFPTYLRRFKLITSDKCTCGEIGTPLHYATGCPKTANFHFRAPAVHLFSAWVQGILKREGSRAKIRKLVLFLKQHPEEIKCSDPEPIIETPAAPLRRSTRLRRQVHPDSVLIELFGEE